MANREKVAAYGAWAAVCFFWGTTYLAIRVGLETLTPMLFGGLRFLIAGVVLFFIMSRQRNVRLPMGREWFDLCLVGFAAGGQRDGGVGREWVSSGMAACGGDGGLGGGVAAKRRGARASQAGLWRVAVGFWVRCWWATFGARWAAVLGDVGLQVRAVWAEGRLLQAAADGVIL